MKLTLYGTKEYYAQRVAQGELHKKLIMAGLNSLCEQDLTEEIIMLGGKILEDCNNNIYDDQRRYDKAVEADANNEKNI